MDRVLARRFFRRTSGRVANWQLITTTAVPLFYDIGLQGKRADYAVKFKEQAASVAKRMTFRIPAPQGSRLGEAVGASCGYPIIVASLGSTRTIGTGRSYTAETRLQGRARRRLRPSVHSGLLTKMDSVGSGACPWDLLSSGIVASVANIANRGRRSVCPTDTATLRPVLW